MHEHSPPNVAGRDIHHSSRRCRTDTLNAMSAPLAVVATCTTVLGLLLAGYGLALWLRIRDLRRRGLTSGVVVDNEITSYAQGRMRFRPVVRFRTGAGQNVTFVGAQGRNRSYVAGSHIVVVYDPDKPDRAAIGTGGAAMSYLVIGSVIAVLGVLMYLVALANPA